MGVFPVDVGAIGADFYTGSLHKWLMGPAGLGFLVVNRIHLPDYNPIGCLGQAKNHLAQPTRARSVRQTIPSVWGLGMR
ncbi:MAG: aminotransferase class V-fold PLP-dependent enzyme [Caldilineaceae bacterium]